jgi:hypothetical protein
MNIMRIALEGCQTINLKWSKLNSTTIKGTGMNLIIIFVLLIDILKEKRC